MTIPVLFTDLDFKIDDRLSATAWNGGLCHGSRADVTPGVTVIVSDGKDVLFATIESVFAPGPAYVVHWNQPTAVPATIHRPSRPKLIPFDGRCVTVGATLSA